MRNKKQQERIKVAIDFFAGGLSGIVSKTIAAPIERVKLILQTQKQNEKIKVKYTGIMNCAIRCIKQEGILSMWRGNMVNVIRYFPTQALNFSFKDFYSRNLWANKPDKSNKFKYTLRKILSGGLAGSTTTFFVHPLDFCRTRIAVDQGKSLAERQFTGIWSCLSKTFNKQGLKGLYRGLAVATLSIFVYRGFYFGLYDATRDLLLTPNTNIFIRLICAQFTVILAEFLSYPGDTVKRKMMMQSLKVYKQYNGAIDCFKKIYASEGLIGFWRGGFSNIIRGFGSAVCLILFDEMKKLANTKFSIQ